MIFTAKKVLYHKPNLVLVSPMKEFPGTCSEKYFTVVINSLAQQARVFVAVRHFHPSRILIGKVGANPSGAPYEAPVNGEAPCCESKHQPREEITESSTTTALPQ